MKIISLKLMASSLVSSVLIISQLSAFNNIKADSISRIYGDLNNDGYVSANDLVLMNKVLVGMVEPSDIDVFDLNNNGIVSIKDSRILIDYILNG